MEKYWVTETKTPIQSIENPLTPILNKNKKNRCKLGLNWV